MEKNKSQKRNFKRFPLKDSEKNNIFNSCMKTFFLIMSIFCSMTAYAQTEMADTLVENTLYEDIAIAEIAIGDTTFLSKMLDFYTKKANDGDPYAQYVVGEYYETGHNVEQSYPEAMKWYTLSADQGFGPAMTSLGIMYMHGKGVEISDDKAMEYLHKAADSGDKRASKILAVDSLTKATMAIFRMPMFNLTPSKLPSTTMHTHIFEGIPKIPVVPFRPIRLPSIRTIKVPTFVPIKVPTVKPIKVPVVRPRIFIPRLR